MSYTPGPWRVWTEKSDGRLTVLEVCETEDRGRHSHFASIARHWPEAEANARLIAAAPDLYEALKELRANVNITSTPGFPNTGLEWLETILKAADAALAKAEGK